MPVDTVLLPSSVSVFPAAVPPMAVPTTGLDNVGEVANTVAPVPVSSVNAVARLALVGVAKKVAIPVPSPLIPVLTGSPVQFVSVPLPGVPNAIAAPNEVSDEAVTPLAKVVPVRFAAAIVPLKAPAGVKYHCSTPLLFQ